MKITVECKYTNVQLSYILFIPINIGRENYFFLVLHNSLTDLSFCTFYLIHINILCEITLCNFNITARYLKLFYERRAKFFFFFCILCILFFIFINGIKINCSTWFSRCKKNYLQKLYQINPGLRFTKVLTTCNQINE